MALTDEQIEEQIKLIKDLSETVEKKELDYEAKEIKNNKKHD